MYVHKSTQMCKLLQEDLQNSFSVDDTKQQPSHSPSVAAEGHDWQLMDAAESQL